MKISSIVTAIFLLFSSQVNAGLSPEQQTAKEQGLILYNQFKATSAAPFLTAAAEAGDDESQYFLAEALRKKNHFMNPEARKWYEAAASQGNLYAMIQLGRDKDDLCKVAKDCPIERKSPVDWLNKAKELAEPRASAKDAEAMYVMYELTLDNTWLEKAATNGHAIAQYWMGILYKQGEGFLLPWNRAEVVEKWFKASAEGGYPKAMMEYAAILFEKGDTEGFRQWNEKAALTGYAPTVYGYGSDLAHEPDTYGYPFDPVKGYALIYLLKELDGGGGMQENVEYKLPLIEKKMTPQQIEEAIEASKTWKASHPPLSFFPDMLSQ